MTGECLKTTVSQMHICRAPLGIMAESLGSCVGVAIWDTVERLGGLVEVMRPYASHDVSFGDLGKYADTGIAELVRRLELQGAKRNHMIAKIVGGANLTELSHVAGINHIGIDNIMAVKQTLDELGVELVAEDVGMDCSRTICFYPEDGSCVITAPGIQKKTI